MSSPAPKYTRVFSSWLSIGAGIGYSRRWGGSAAGAGAAGIAAPADSAWAQSFAFKAGKRALAALMLPANDLPSLAKNQVLHFWETTASSPGSPIPDLFTITAGFNFLLLVLHRADRSCMLVNIWYVEISLK